MAITFTVLSANYLSVRYDVEADSVDTGTLSVAQVISDITSVATGPSALLDFLSGNYGENSDDEIVTSFYEGNSILGLRGRVWILGSDTAGAWRTVDSGGSFAFANALNGGAFIGIELYHSIVR